ncbi:MAG: hypothetical protein IJB10_02275 [Clostridia bacterium]|nr:hypothetical protein [Clostridia bacterium]
MKKFMPTIEYKGNKFVSNDYLCDRHILFCAGHNFKKSLKLNSLYL